MAFAAFNVASYAQGAKIEFKDKDNTIDYGKVYKESDSGMRSFEFKNTGDAPLIIMNVQSTCGCTIPTKPTAPIMPGKTGKIDVKYNMNPGPIRKTITVETNAINVEGGRIAIKIKGEVLVKDQVNILERKKGRSDQRTIKIVRASIEALFFYSMSLSWNLNLRLLPLRSTSKLSHFPSSDFNNSLISSREYL